MNIDRNDLDRHITGNWGEDSVPDDGPEVSREDVLAAMDRWGIDPNNTDTHLIVDDDEDDTMDLLWEVNQDEQMGYSNAELRRDAKILCTWRREPEILEPDGVVERMP